jgi:hypothetical protein
MAALEFQLKLLQGKMQDVGVRNDFFRPEFLTQLLPKPSKQLKLMVR